MRQCWRAQVSRETLAGVVGNMLEWYDFAVFGYLASEIGSNFFPPQGETAELVEAFSVFGGAFFARPLGGMLFGYIGDNMGRTKALKLSVVLMTACTFAMGLLPTYHTLGFGSTALLVILRLLQGVSVGGQLVGSFIYTIECAPPHKRAQVGGLCLGTANMGSVAGSSVAALLHACMDEDTVRRWGWRLPFLAGLVIGLASIKLQSEAMETAHFQAQPDAKDARSPMRIILRRHKMRVLFATGSMIAWPTAFYLWYMWLPTFQTTLMKRALPNDGSSFFLSCVFLTIGAFILPAFGHLADRTSTRFVSLIGCVAVAVLSPPMLLVVSLGNLWYSLLAYVVITPAVCCFGGPMAAHLCQAFPVSVRYSGIGIAYNLGQALFGGSVAVVATQLTNMSEVAPGVFVSGIAFVAFLFLLAAPHALTKGELYGHMADSASQRKTPNPDEGVLPPQAQSTGRSKVKHNPNTEGKRLLREQDERRPSEESTPSPRQSLDGGGDAKALPVVQQDEES